MDYKTKYIKYKNKYLNLVGAGEAQKRERQEQRQRQQEQQKEQEKAHELGVTIPMYRKFTAFQNTSMTKEAKRTKLPEILYQAEIPPPIILEKGADIKIFTDGEYYMTQYFKPDETMKDYHLVVDIYDDNYEDPIEEKTHQSVSINNIQIKKTEGKCNKIISLLHGTPLKFILSILEDNTIKFGMGENTGVSHRIETISTYPILNCDIDKYYPISRTHGEAKIFLKPTLLNEYSSWTVSNDENSHGKIKRGNITDYFNFQSKNRHNLYHDPKSTLNETKAKLIETVLSELAFQGAPIQNGIINIKDYIQFIAIADDGKKETNLLINKIRGMGIKVFKYPKDSLWMEKYFFE